MRQYLIVFLISFIFSLTIGFALLNLKPSDIVPGATSYPVTRNCDLIYFDKTLQPVNTLVLACTKTDMIRLWPMPLQQPWFEDTNPCDEIGSKCVEL